MIRIERIDPANRRQLRTFIDFPHDLYEGDPNYVPMLYMEQEALLNPRKSPFFRHSTAEYFMAYDDGRPVGRIAAILNRNHIAFTGRREGFFGFFDVVNDAHTTAALLATAEQWLRQQGVEKVIGPANFSTNETCGLLVENFEQPPMVMMTYNAPYYATLLEGLGFSKHVDLLCYWMKPGDVPASVVEASQRLEERLAERGIVVRKINMRRFEEELDKFLPVYNASWAENTGFVPMTEAEVRQIAKDLRPIIDPELVFFAEKDGQTIGVSLTVPNINEILIRLKRGRLFPFGIFRLLFGLRNIRTARVVALGTLQEYRRLGIDTCFYVRTQQAAVRRGIIEGEASWILDNNAMMNRAMERLGARVYRKYRLYEKTL
jgi:GNAT superfamily N-acetyltransferase